MRRPENTIEIAHASETAAELASPHAGRSYWEIVKRQYFKSRPATVGLAIVMFLFVVAMLAPLLANNKPLLMRVAGRYSSPVLVEMLHPSTYASGGVDAFFNALLFVGVAAALAYLPLRLAMRRRLRYGQPVRWRKWFFMVCAVAVVVVMMVLRNTGMKNLELYDYRRMAAQAGPGDFYVFPPIPYGPYENNPVNKFGKIDVGQLHLLGTDQNGRDVLARIIHGSRISLSVGFVSVSIAMVIGCTLGALAGYFGGAVDAVIMRLIEIMMCFPSFFLILAIIAFLEEPSIFAIMAVIGVTGWTGVARLVRAEFFKQKGSEYVMAAKAAGAGAGRMIFRQILPNAIQPAFVSATFGVAGAILTESALSFLGLGVPPPISSWGAMIDQGRQNMLNAPLLSLWPGIAIFITITSYNLVGEGLRDALDPRLKV